MKEVNSNFNFRGALNAEHFQVHSDLLAAIPVEVASGLGLTGLRDQYAELFEEENSCYLLNRSYIQSDEIREKHASRVQQFSYILKYIDNESEAGGECLCKRRKPCSRRQALSAAKRMRYAARPVRWPILSADARSGLCDITKVAIDRAVKPLETLNQRSTPSIRAVRAIAHQSHLSLRWLFRPLGGLDFSMNWPTINALYRVNR